MRTLNRFIPRSRAHGRPLRPSTLAAATALTVMAGLVQAPTAAQAAPVAGSAPDRKGGRLRMIKPVTPLHAALNDYLAPRGFIRRSNDWRKINDETIQVVNLQKSNYGSEYFINFGVWLRLLDPEMLRPQEFKCQLRARIGELCPEHRVEFNRLLNLDVDLAAGVRTAELTSLLEICLDDALLDATASVQHLKSPSGFTVLKRLSIWLEDWTILGLETGQAM